MEIKKTVHINDLLKGSSVYGDINGMDVQQVLIMKDHTLVKYDYDGNSFIDVWIVKDGEVLYDTCDSPNLRYHQEETEYHVLRELIGR